MLIGALLFFLCAGVLVVLGIRTDAATGPVGWTVLGWIGALVWSFTSQVDSAAKPAA
jgi:hypothetical protein